MPRANLPPHIAQPRGPGTVCFARVSVPVALQGILGCKEFKASTKLTDPHKAYAVAASWISDWKDRIAAAQDAAPDAHRARVLQLATAFRQHKRPDLDDAGVALLMDSLEYAFEHGRADLIPALASQPDARLALPSPTVIDQITGHATPFLTHFEGWKAATHVKGDSLKTYESDIRHFARAVSEPIETLTRRHIVTWTETLRKADLAADTVRRKLSAVRTYWNWLDEHELVPKDSAPFAGIKIQDPRSKAQREEDARQRFPIVALPKLWQAAEAKGDTALATLIKIGAYTGARIELICGLKVTDVLPDPDTGIRILHFRDKTGAGVRNTPRHSEIVALIDALVANADKDGYLFHGNFKGRRSSTLSTRFTDLKRELGFTDPRLVFHSIRHTVLHLFEIAQCPVGIAQDIAGHEKEGLSYGVYSGDSPLALQAEWLEKAIRYPVAAS